MEASGAGGGAPAAAQQGTAQSADGGDATQQATAPDFGALQSKFDAMEGTQKEMFAWMQSQAAAMPAEEQTEDDAALAAADLSFLDEDDPNYDPDQAAQNLAALIEKSSQQQAQALVAPLAQEVQAMRTARAVDDLTARIPELKKPEVANEVIRISQEKAHQMGRPDLAGDPEFWELIYRAGRSADREAKEGQEPGVAHLEGANGAGPGGGGQVDLGDAIVNAKGRGSSVLPFG